MISGLPPSIESLIEALRTLPGIGAKTAARLAIHLIKRPEASREKLGNAILDAKKGLQKCNTCGHFSVSEKCDICQSESREKHLLCIVEDSLDLLAIEKTNSFKGKYHVLGGALAPLEGIGPEDLNLHSLIKRLEKGAVTEIILATNPTLEGEATSALIQRRTSHIPNIRITRIARGIPIGGDVEYADEMTLARALENRMDF